MYIHVWNTSLDAGPIRYMECRTWWYHGTMWQVVTSPELPSLETGVFPVAEASGCCNQVRTTPWYVTSRTPGPTRQDFWPSKMVCFFEYLVRKCRTIISQLTEVGIEALCVWATTDFWERRIKHQASVTVVTIVNPDQRFLAIFNMNSPIGHEFNLKHVASSVLDSSRKIIQKPSNTLMLSTCYPHVLSFMFYHVSIWLQYLQSRWLFKPELDQATQEFTLSIPAKTTQAPQSTEPRSTRGPLTSRGFGNAVIELGLDDLQSFTKFQKVSQISFQILKYSARFIDHWSSFTIINQWPAFYCWVLEGDLYKYGSKPA